MVGTRTPAISSSIAAENSSASFSRVGAPRSGLRRVSSMFGRRSSWRSANISSPTTLLRELQGEPQTPICRRRAGASRIVEIGALVEGHGFMFSTVVNPGQDASIDQSSVHGIPASELLSGPCFSEAFWRFDSFLRHASLSILDAEDDSEDEQQTATAMKPDQDILIVA